MLVSIIIPVYNGERFIQECVESALNQDYEEIEVIVVNDGSTDKTLDILKHYDNQIILINQDNYGVSSALNRGILHSKGEWIHRLSADDVLYYHAISSMVKNIKSNNEIYYSDYNIINAKGEIIKPFIEPIERNSKSKVSRFNELVNNFYGNGSSAIFHKSLFDKIQFDESISYYEDYDFWLNAMNNGYDLILIPIITCQYRRHENQMTKRIDRSFSEIIRNRYR